MNHALCQIVANETSVLSVKGGTVWYRRIKPNGMLSSYIIRCDSLAGPVLGIFPSGKEMYIAVYADGTLAHLSNDPGISGSVLVEEPGLNYGFRRGGLTYLVEDGVLYCQGGQVPVMAPVRLHSDIGEIEQVFDGSVHGPRVSYLVTVSGDIIRLTQDVGETPDCYDQCEVIFSKTRSNEKSDDE